RVETSIFDIVAKRVVEKHGVLRNDSNRIAQALLFYVANILTVNRDTPRAYVVESVEKPRECRFTRPAGSNNGHFLTGGNLKAHVVENRSLRLVMKAHQLKSHIGGIRLNIK